MAEVQGSTSNESGMFVKELASEVEAPGLPRYHYSQAIQLLNTI